MLGCSCFCCLPTTRAPAGCVRDREFMRILGLCWRHGTSRTRPASHQPSLLQPRISSRGGHHAHPLLSRAGTNAEKAAILRAIHHSSSVAISAVDLLGGRLYSTGMRALALISIGMRRLGIGARLADCMRALCRDILAEAAGTSPVRCRTPRCRLARRLQAAAGDAEGWTDGWVPKRARACCGLRRR